MIRKTLLILWIIWSVNNLFAQSGTIKGTVKDAESGELIPMANVVVESNGTILTGAKTDFDGNYTIKPVPAGKFDVKVSYIGYSEQKQKGVIVSVNKITFLDFKIKKSALELGEVEIVDYKVPLIDKDQTESGGTVTSEEIQKISGRSISNVVTTVGGVYSENGEIGSIRGSRSDGNVYFIDGVKVQGTYSLPKSAVDQISVVTGGVAAKYGDVTGGVINVTTKGPSREFNGGVEVVTSQFLDPYGYNLGGVNLSGPLLSIRDKNDTANKRTIAGFLLSAEGQYVVDGDPSAIGYYKVKDDVKEYIINTPLRETGLGFGTYKNADFLHSDSFEKTKVALNTEDISINFAGKIDISPVKDKGINITIGGTYNYQNNKGSSFAGSLFNWDNTSRQYYNNWRAYVRFTQKFTSSSPATREEASSFVIKNAYYSIQADYSKTTSLTWNENHKDDLFKYGYVGKFTTHKIETYTQNLEYDPVTGLWGHLQNGFLDSSYQFEYSPVNHAASKYTECYYNMYSVKEGKYQNKEQVQSGGGLLNGEMPDGIYSMWTSPGVQTNTYQKTESNQFRLSATGFADIKEHEISLGFEFEQRLSRVFNSAPIGLWTLARQLTNNHIIQLNTLDPQEVKDANGVFQDTIWYNRLYSASNQALFDINLREHLGKKIDDTEWLDLDSYDPSDLKLDYFSADELLNSGNSYVGYYGYDHHGNKLDHKPSFNDFFTATYEDKAGNQRYKREIAPFEPNYMAAYIQDKFGFRDLVFNLGIRVDRYDANQMVLKDPYCLYETYKAGDQKVKDIKQTIPDNIGDDYVVYVDKMIEPTAIFGYRDGSTWYDAKGTVVTDPSLIATGTGITPYLVNPGIKLNADGFKDYEPDITVMPRISFSFPISEEALFFAHYDVLTKRPSSNRLDPLSYYFITSNNNLIGNPDLKPERTIDYELGFQQKISNTSSLKLSAFYREMRDQIQAISMAGAYPVNYKTYGNIDFGTIKGFSATYDMRRTGNISAKLTYTMQFANGTGSDATQQLSLINSGQPNLRATIPLNYDQRHNISCLIDYRFGGKANMTPYNGPIVAGKNIFANMGANFTVNIGSGSPYTQQTNIIPWHTTGGSNFIEGSINGARKPWRSSIDARFDRDILLAWGKEGKQKALFLNVYIEILNLFNKLNVLDVYSATGNADDDGYLNAAEYQDQIASQNDETAFRNYYTMALNYPYFYNAPRRIRFGVMVNF